MVFLEFFKFKILESVNYRKATLIGVSCDLLTVIEIWIVCSNYPKCYDYK